MGRWKKGAPGTGDRPRVDQFSYTRTQPGLKGTWYGWCACEPEWFEVHEHKDSDPGTKVCLTWFTDGALRCPRCKPLAKVTTVGYCPIWREEDRAPCMVIVHERAADKMQGLEYGVYVMVSCVDKKGGVVVQRATEQRRWVTELEHRKSPCCLAPQLQAMWGYPQLDDWLKRADTRGRNGTAVRSNGQPFSPMHQAAARLNGADVIPPEGAVIVGGAVDGVLGRIGLGTAPSANGKHGKHDPPE